ncbi:MAG: hypothetical protein ABIU77_06385 [Ferruginibacter sp.]
MQSRHCKSIALFSFVSLTLGLIIFWLNDFLGIQLPQIIPGIELSTYGILILLSYIGIFVLQQKLAVKAKADITVFQLVSDSTIIAAVSQFLYFPIRELILGTDISDRIIKILTVSLISTVVLCLIAAAIAVEIKKIKGGLRHLPTIILILLVFLLKNYINDFKW